MMKTNLKRVIVLDGDDVEYSWEPQYAALQGYVGDIRKPFEECPHCGEYRYTKVREPVQTTAKYGSPDLHWLKRLLAAREIVTVGYLKREICKNCDYSSDWREEIDEEYQDKVEITSYGNVLKEETLYIGGGSQ